MYLCPSLILLFLVLPFFLMFTTIISTLKWYFTLDFFVKIYESTFKSATTWIHIKVNPTKGALIGLLS